MAFKLVNEFLKGIALLLFQNPLYKILTSISLLNHIVISLSPGDSPLCHGVESAEDCGCPSAGSPNGEGQHSPSSRSHRHDKKYTFKVSCAKGSIIP